MLPLPSYNPFLPAPGKETIKAPCTTPPPPKSWNVTRPQDALENPNSPSPRPGRRTSEVDLRPKTQKDFFNLHRETSFRTKRLLLASYLEYMEVDDDAEQVTPYMEALQTYVTSASDSTPALDSSRKIFSVVQAKTVVFTGTDARKSDAQSSSSTATALTKLGNQPQPAPSTLGNASSCSVCLAENVMTSPCSSCKASLCQECSKDNLCKHQEATH